jgi:hypothetical protein
VDKEGELLPTLQVTGTTELEHNANKEPTAPPGPSIVREVKGTVVTIVKIPPPPGSPGAPFPELITFPVITEKHEPLSIIVGFPVFVVKLNISSISPPVAVITITKLLTGSLKLKVYEKGPNNPSQIEFSGVVYPLEQDE